MLRVLRMVLGTAARQQHADENLVDDIRLGATEAFRAALDEQRDARSNAPVTVEFDFADTFDVRVTFVRPGRACPAEMRAAHRLGVIEGIADDVDIQCGEGLSCAISLRWMQADTRR